MQGLLLHILVVALNTHCSRKLLCIFDSELISLKTLFFLKTLLDVLVFVLRLCVLFLTLLKPAV